MSECLSYQGGLTPSGFLKKVAAETPHPDRLWTPFRPLRSEARRACYLPQVLKFGLGAAAVEVLLSRLGVLSGFDLPLWAAMYASYATTTWRCDSAEAAISGR